MAQSQIQVVEERYTTFMNTLYEKALDLNVPMSQVANQCMALMNQREELLRLYGVVTTGGPAMPGAAAAAPAANSYKNKIQELAAKRAGKQVLKEDFVYETAEVGNKTWVTTLTSPLLTSAYMGETPQTNKKAAELAACEAALKAEFAEEYAQIESGMTVMPQRGTKRRSEPTDPMLSDDNKGKLSHVMSLLLERTVTKADLVYTMDATGSTCTLSIPNYEGGKTFAGEAGATEKAAAKQKAAEASAAGMALAAFEPAIGPAIEAHKQKKIRKAAEMQAKRKDRHTAGVAAVAVTA